MTPQAVKGVRQEYIWIRDLYTNLHPYKSCPEKNKATTSLFQNVWHLRVSEPMCNLEQKSTPTRLALIMNDCNI